MNMKKNFGLKPDRSLVLAHPPPLVLDVDDALLKTDLLHETALTYLKTSIFAFFNLMLWLLKGKAVLKRRLAERVILNVDDLPVNTDLVAFAADAHASGRKIGLATAADELLIRRLGKRFNFVSFVVASDGLSNMKGRTKAAELNRLFPGGFAYAGDSHSDIEVWRHAKSMVLVGTDGDTTRRALALGKPVEAHFKRPRLGLRGWAKALRVHQWAKNALVFLPMILAGMANDPLSIVNATIAFVCMSLMASGTYLINDLFDLADDRAHPGKRNRPLASGALRIKHGIALALLLISGSLALGFFLGVAVIALLATYLLVTLGYSFYLKRQTILDAFTLAALFTMRLGLGVAAVGATASPWLLVFSMFLFTSLAFAKRQSEIQRNLEEGKLSVKGRGYLTSDAAIVLSLGITTAIAAINILVLYIMNDVYSADFYTRPLLLWMLPACLFMWLCRIWVLCHRGQLHEDPVAFAVRDRLSLGLAGLMGTAFLGGWLL